MTTAGESERAALGQVERGGGVCFIRYSDEYIGFISKAEQSLSWLVNFGSKLLRVTLDGYVVCISCLPLIPSKKG